MIYFGENNEYILCECETCKGEMYIERSSVSEEDAYSYHLYIPVKCRCGSVDEYINRAKKSCYNIKKELSALTDFLRRQQGVSNKISDITAELNKRFDPPSFWQSLGYDCASSLKTFGILLGAAIGLEALLFIITAIMFAIGYFFTIPDLSRIGNEIFYHINIFKDWSGALLSRFGLPETYNRLDPALASERLILDYIPYAVAGVALLVFYIFLAVLFVRVGINLARITFFASKVVNQKIKINQKREDYRKQLDDLGLIYQDLTEKIGEFTILPADYKNIKAAESILRSFINNRVDNIREAINLFHEDDFRGRMLEYGRGAYNEARQTRRYTKALYMLTSDDNIKVDVKEVREDPAEAENMRVGEMLKDAFSKIKKPSEQKRLAPARNLPPPHKKSSDINTGAAPKSETPDEPGGLTDENEYEDENQILDPADLNSAFDGLDDEFEFEEFEDIENTEDSEDSEKNNNKDESGESLRTIFDDEPRGN